eukprot:CAMPEP_0174878512 /NCGR_PEP_ID=MMETSP1114-20130205/82797_1 /TAXON_ID=312471 /ORGANISM="Neobodo designis, Strain CCAP 1951/1" /LENGTH=185 /DNA_ID=CAMNT_0016113901 /DNA_START=533 /DNA_END=1090 /DNA_ORIENTATION=-
MSSASSTVHSRIEALRLQLAEERRRRETVLHQIDDLKRSSTERAEEVACLPTAAALALHDRVTPCATSNSRLSASASLPRQEKRDSHGSPPSRNASHPAEESRPDKRVRKALPLTLAAPGALAKLTQEPPRKPPLPAAARRNATRREGGNYSLVGRRKPTAPELYVARMRHEDRLALVRKFSLDV